MGQLQELSPWNSQVGIHILNSTADPNSQKPVQFVPLTNGFCCGIGFQTNAASIFNFNSANPVKKLGYLASGPDNQQVSRRETGHESVYPNSNYSHKGDKMFT